MIHARLSYLSEIFLRDETAPVLGQSGFCYILAQDLRERPLVDSIITDFVKDGRGNPWLQNKPTTKVYTANLAIRVVE